LVTPPSSILLPLFLRDLPGSFCPTPSLRVLRLSRERFPPPPTSLPDRLFLVSPLLTLVGFFFDGSPSFSPFFTSPIGFYRVIGFPRMVFYLSFLVFFFVTPCCFRVLLVFRPAVTRLLHLLLRIVLSTSASPFLGPCEYPGPDSSFVMHPPPAR